MLNSIFVSFVNLLYDPRSVVILLSALAAFVAVLGVVSPMMQTDPLQERMRLVEIEREKLRAQRKAQVAASEARLREKPGSNLAKRIVDGLRLDKVFETEPSRDLLKQAGFRSERHLTFYFAMRIAIPIATAMAAFLYASAFYAEYATPPMLISVSAGGMLAGNYVPQLFLRNLVQRRQESIRRAWPEALDLMLICVEAGMGIEPTMQRVAREIGTVSPPLAEEIALTVAELSFLQERRKAFENLGRRTGLPQVKSVVTSLIQSERYGTPLGTALRVLAQENRDMRMMEAERRALALPPRLAVPMMLFFIPVVFVILMTPAIMEVSKYF